MGSHCQEWRSSPTTCLHNPSGPGSADRKSLRTKLLEEAKQLATEEYVALKAHLRNGEMVFSKTTKELVTEYLAVQEKRVRPTPAYPPAEIFTVREVRHLFRQTI